MCQNVNPLIIVIDSASPLKKEIFLQMDWTEMDFLATYLWKSKFLSKAFHRNIIELYANFLKGFFL